ncbi:MAG: DUF5671 domain-containing protein [Acidimicrobiia bacterium]
MWAVFGVLIGLAALGLPVLVVVLIVRAGKRGATGAQVPGAPLRRFFQYGLMYLALVLSGWGLTGLIEAAVEGGDLLRGRSQVAGALSLVVVAAPVFLVLASWTRRRLADDEGERLSIGWLLYLTAAILSALVTAMFALTGFISSVLGDAAWSATLWIKAAVWGAVWWAHWWAARRYPPPDAGRSHRLLGSLFGLWGTLVSVIAIGVIFLDTAYYELFGRGLLSSPLDDLRRFVGPLVVSGAVWWWYWHRHTRTESDSTGWQAHVLLGGVLVGLLSVIVAGGVILFSVLGWFLLDSRDTALDAFAPVPSALALAAVGWLSWAYHRRVLDSAPSARAGEVRRTYTYLLSAVGLSALVLGLTFLIAATIGAAIGGAVLSIFDGGHLALWGLTLVIVGTPLWWRAWSSVQGEGLDGVDERTSLARRLYLSASFGIGGLLALVALITVASRFFEDLFEGSFSSATIYDVRWSVSLVLAVGAMAAYHWRVFRADRQAQPAGTTSLERLLLVAPGEAAALGRALAARTGARVEVWRTGDGEASIEALVASLDGIDGTEGVVVVGPDGVVTGMSARRLG